MVREMKHLFAVAGAGLLFVLAAEPGLGEGVGSYGRVVQRCSLTMTGQTIPFRCRWMWNGLTDETSFVDNYDTTERYVVEAYRWSRENHGRDKTKPCIKSPGGAIVCLLN